MAEIVNLRLARKRAARAEQEKIAAANRARHGRGKAEKQAEAAERRRAAAHLDGHLRGARGEPETR